MDSWKNYFDLNQIESTKRDCVGISLYSAMGMVKRKHEFVESAEDRDSEALASISIEALKLSEDLEQSVKLAGEPVMFSPIIPTVEAVQTLSVVSTWSNGQSVGRLSKGVIPALSHLLGGGEDYTSDSMLDIALPIAAQQQLRSEDL
ncbi:hypothetical protein AYI68_g8362 [Smittium mucronatum]|uniref:Uncharacterized protein n=1 Tax=Smittium mucronatum TaxID=133383 RepID=A0A1R0GL36_9FUNG|nr:hypothetical protein AYI68_g8362 [Smittium mucronatum]